MKNELECIGNRADYMKERISELEDQNIKKKNDSGRRGEITKIFKR